jgi:hypothetical protein
VLVAVVVCLVSARGEVNAGVRGVTTGAALDDLSGALAVVMAQGERSGDYVLAKAAVKTRHAIDVWRATNRELLEQPFADLDPALRDTFIRTRSLSGEASLPGRHHPELAQALTEQASRIVELRPGPPREVHVLAYSPRILSPQATPTFTVRVRGLNLEQADPILHLPGGPAERTLHGPHEAHFTVPVEAVPSHPTHVRVHPLHVTYTAPLTGFWARFFGRTEFLTRQLSIVTLPTSVATFELTAMRTTDTRSEMPFTAEPVQFRGTREQLSRTVTPPPGSHDGTVAWRWDLSKDLRLVQSRGLNGRCESIDLNRSSEIGVTVVARVEGEARGGRRKRQGTPGWVDCTLVGTVYRTERVSIPVEPQTATLTWTKDVTLPLPPDAHDAELMVSTFDGRRLRVAGSDADKFFEVRREPDRFVIVPRIPADVLAGD